MVAGFWWWVRSLCVCVCVCVCVWRALLFFDEDRCAGGWFMQFHVCGVWFEMRVEGVYSNLVILFYETG